MDNSITEPRARDLAGRFHEANASAIAFVEGCPLTRWSSRTKEEGWTLSMAAAHIAIGHLVIARWSHRIACGLDVTETAADVDALNASDERYASALSQPEVAERLSIYGAALERFVSDLSDDRLASRAMCMGREWSTEDMVREAIDHTREHLEHMVAGASAIA
jgi:DinB superfamily